MHITAQALYNITKCAHRVYLDANGDPKDRSEVGSFVKLLWELGLQTEREYIGTLGNMAISDLSQLGIEAAWAETQRLMKEGAALIYQGCLVDGSFVGRPDLLLKRTDLSSCFGPYGYEPIDIKAGKGWEEREGKRTKFKNHYAFQILFYRMVLDRLQGASLPIGRIVNVERQLEEFAVADFEQDFLEALAEAQRLVSGQDTSEPVLGSHCQLCQWYRRCERWVNEKADPTGLFFVGKVKFDLKQVGLKNIEDIAAMDVNQYLKPPRKIPRMGKESLMRMKERARVRLSGKPEIRPGFTFPSRLREVYFDIEDDPTRGVTYLFGLLIKEQGRAPDFQYFLAKRPDQEEVAVRAFWNFLLTAGDDVYYVYSAKERSTLKQLMQRYSLDSTVLEAYKEKEFDLYNDLIVKYSDWPTYSYGIKQIAKQIGFYWRDPDPSGANSIAWYNQYLANPTDEAPLQRILTYNEDDCFAMVAVKDYFEQTVS